MAWVLAGRLGRRARFAAYTAAGSAWAVFSVPPASAKAVDHTIPEVAITSAPTDHKSTNILSQALVGIGILVAVGIIVFLLTRGRGRGNPGSGGGGGGGGGGFHPRPDPPPGGRQAEVPVESPEESPVESSAQEKTPVYQGSSSP